MESKVKFLGHPVHPMLIVFPVGLLVATVVFDLVYVVRDMPEFAVVAFWMIVAGLIGGILAIAFGLLDWAAVPSDTRAKRIGLIHGIGNILIAGLFAVSAYLRWDAAGHIPSTVSIVLEPVGLALLGVTAWLGGELVDRLGVGVDRGANLNAPNSLSGRTADEGTEGEWARRSINSPVR